MRRSLGLSLLAVFVVALASAPTASAAVPCTKTWTGPATGLWNQGANWTPTGIPGASDVVCIGPDTDTTLDTAFTIATLRSEGVVRTPSGSSGNSSDLTITDAAEPSSIDEFHLVRAGLYGDADVTIRRLVWGTTFTGIEMGGTGTTTVTEHHEFGDANQYLLEGRTLVTEGTGTWSPNSFRAYGNALWINRAAVTYAGGGNMNATAVGGETPIFVNEAGASVTKSGSGNKSISLAVENDGVIEDPDGLSNGYLVVGNASGTSSGDFLGLRVAGDHMFADGAYIRDSLVLDDSTLAPGATVEMDGGELYGGSIVGPGILILSGDLTATFGRFGDAESLVVVPVGAYLHWTAAMFFTPRRFETHGTVEITDTGAGRPPGTFGERMVWENTGTVILHSRQLPVFAGDERAQILNRGTIVKKSTSTIEVEPTIVNDGLVDIQLGRLEADRFEQTANGTLRFGIEGESPRTEHGELQASQLRYGGRLEAELRNDYEPPGDAVFNVIATSASNRSGSFLSTAPAGLTLDETGSSSSIRLLGPDADPGGSASSALAPKGRVTGVVSPALVPLPPAVALSSGPAARSASSRRTRRSRVACSRRGGSLSKKHTARTALGGRRSVGGRSAKRRTATKRSAARRCATKSRSKRRPGRHQARAKS